MNRENKRKTFEKVTIKPIIVLTALPAKSAVGCVRRKMRAAGTATIVPTACPAFM